VRAELGYASIFNSDMGGINDAETVIPAEASDARAATLVSGDEESSDKVKKTVTR